MDGQQPGKTYKPDQPENQQAGTPGNGASDEIAQIDSAVQSNPVETTNADVDGETPDGSSGIGTEPAPNYETPVQTPVYEEVGNVTPEEPALQNTAADNDSSQKPSLLLSWQSGGDISDRGPTWYATIFVVTVTFAGLTILVTGSWLSAVVVVLAAATLIVVNTKSPQVQAYGIFDAGVQIEERFYGYDQLRSFNLNSTNGETLIELEPSKRFYPRITMHAGDYIDQAQELLAQFLPKNHREPDVIDVISKRFKL